MKTSTKIIIALAIIILAVAGWKYYTSNKSTPETINKPSTQVEKPSIVAEKSVIKADPIDTAITGDQ
jgi:hypothetical protein